MRTRPSFANLKYGSACDDFAPVRNKAFQNLLEIQHFRLAANQCHHIDAKHRLQLRLAIQIIQQHLRVFATPHINHDAHAVFVRLIA